MVIERNEIKMTKAEGISLAVPNLSQIHGSNWRKFLVACSTVPPFEGNGCSRRSQSFHSVVPLVLQDAIFGSSWIWSQLLCYRLMNHFLSTGWTKLINRQLRKSAPFRRKLRQAGLLQKVVFSEPLVVDSEILNCLCRMWALDHACFPEDRLFWCRG